MDFIYSSPISQNYHLLTRVWVNKFNTVPLFIEFYVVKNTIDNDRFIPFDVQENNCYPQCIINIPNTVLEK